MIGALKGIVGTSGKNPAIVFVGGVGYAVNCTGRTIARKRADDDVFLHIHTHVREDALDLYGFETPEELAVFELLLAVPGIGPKTALGVTDLGVDAIRRAIQTSDVAFFTAVPRLGKKNAQKIIIELTSKLGSTRELDLTGTGGGETEELTEALVSMGFARKEIAEALKKLTPDDRSLEQRLRHALTLLGK